MLRHRTLGLAALLTAWMALSSCGGGGGGGGSSNHPVSGAYGWVVHQPDASAPLQLSLVHPSRPDTEYRFTQRADLGVGFRAVLYSGTVNSGAQEINGIQPHTMLMFPSDIRSVSLQADGAEPVSRSVFTGSLIACGLLMVANDYANPMNSRIIVLPAVPPGGCGFDPTFETPPRGSEGNIELRFSANGELVASRMGIPFERPFGVLRDPSSLAPRAWLYENRVLFWNDGEGTSVPLSPARSIVLSTDRSAIVQPEEGGLSVLSFPGGTTINETQLDPSLTTAKFWASIGYDADAYYLATWDDSTSPARWTILKITRSSPVATVLATGSGGFGDASVGNKMLYVSVNESDQTRLLRIDKSGGPVAETAYPAATQPIVHTSPSGVHMLELKDTSTTDAQKPVTSTTLRFIDENDNTLYTADQGFPMASVEASTVNLGRSSNTTVFLFAVNTSQSLADATLTAYDATTRRATALGNFPGAAEYGAGVQIGAYVDAAGPANAGAGAAAGPNGQKGNVKGSTGLFSFDLATPNSLRYTKVVK